MTDQPPADSNRYARLSPLAQALVDDYDQIALAELLVKADDDLERARRELADRDAAESADAAAGSYAGRAEAAEAKLEEARRQHRETCPFAQGKLNGAFTCGMCDALANEEPAIAQPEPWLHVQFTSPDDTTANTSALAIRDHLQAEFPGVGMRITTNAVEADEPEHICKPGTSTYFCPASGEMESDCHGGFAQCCDRPGLHRPGPAVAEATDVGTEFVQQLDHSDEEAFARIEADLVESGIDTPGCDCGHDGMGISWHGDDCPWRRDVLDGTAPTPAPPGLREQLHTAIESELYEYRERTMWWPEETGGVTKEIARLAARGAMEVLAGQPAPAWAPPPPGSTAEQIPDHLLALINRLPDYTSTACQTADTLACTACYPGSGIPRPQYDEIREHAERLHSRCRTNQKFTGQLCACGCHPEEQP